MSDFRSIQPIDLRPYMASERLSNGQTVFLRHRDEKRPGTVVVVQHKIDGGVTYGVAWPHLEGDIRYHYSAELTTEFEPGFH